MPTKTEPFKGVIELRDDFDLFLDRFWGEETAVWARHKWKPPLEISEDEDSIVLRMRTPGVRKEDLRIMLDRNTLVVFSNAGKGKTVNKKNYTSDLHSGNFKRSFALPVFVNRLKIEAVFENGFLQITMPKTREAAEREKTRIYMMYLLNSPAFALNTLPERNRTDEKG